MDAAPKRRSAYDGAMTRVFHDAQIRALRDMTVAERLRLNASLWDHARALKEATLRAQHPDWTQERVRVSARKALQGERG